MATGVTVRRGGHSRRGAGRGGRRGVVIGHQVGNAVHDSAEKVECLKYFPKPFRNETGSEEGDYYISYRRRSPENGGETAKRDCRVGNRTEQMDIDNSWVVPYNETLSRVFNCHFNVEMCI